MRESPRSQRRFIIRRVVRDRGMNLPTNPVPPPNPPLPSTNPDTAPALAASAASVPPTISDAPLPQMRATSSSRKATAVLLSLCLVLFLVAGVFSLLDDSLVLFLDLHFLTTASGILTFLTFLAVMLVYGLVGLTPIVPKRIFLPIILFTALDLLAVFPVLIYRHHWLLQMDWTRSLLQVALALSIVRRLRVEGKLRWPIVTVEHLETRAFSWLNLCAFLLLNVFALLPAFVVYLALCASLALGHFSDGFLALRPSG
ncbi:MAG: hypothetical protein JWM99_487, partial [Verrucomicrobiales bacterium]|nr:hypothetical protein [Verrucomicrobiales bacterium]